MRLTFKVLLLCAAVSCLSSRCAAAEGGGRMTGHPGEGSSQPPVIDCEANPEDPTCQEQAVDCEAHPQHPACAKDLTEPLTEPFDCTATPEDPACQEVDCKANPQDPACPAPDSCDVDPRPPECDFGVDMDCGTNPDDPACIDCGANSDDPACVDCRATPDHELCKDPGPDCKADPSAPGCQRRWGCTQEPCWAYSTGGPAIPILPVMHRKTPPPPPRQLKNTGARPAPPPKKTVGGGGSSGGSGAPGGGKGCNCIMMYQPVCGRDGKIYSNSCFAGCANQPVMGACGSHRSGPACWLDCQARTRGGCRCGFNWQPTCGADGKVYSNACFAKCKAGAVQFWCGSRSWPACKKRCQEAAAAGSKGCVCPEIWAPVCGIDGKVYENECKAECEEQSVRWACGRRRNCAAACRAAAAPPRRSCRMEHAPVCGRNRKLYSNACLAERAGTAVRFPCGRAPATVCAAICKGKSLGK